MLARLGCLFILVPLVELALLIEVGRWIGLWPTIFLVAVTGLAGAALARAQGLQVIARVQLELARGRLPGRSLMDGAAVLVGGALLLTPGILTDAVGFALLFPPTRRLIQGWVLARLGRAVARGTLRVRYMETYGPGREGPRGDQGAGGPAPHHEEGRDDEDDGRPPRPGEIVQE